MPPPLPKLPSQHDLQSDDPEAKERVADFREALVDGPRRLAAVHPPLIVFTLCECCFRAPLDIAHVGILYLLVLAAAIYVG